MSWGSKRDQLTERENLVARQLLRSLGFATDCWSVWDELPEPVGLSIGRERAGRVVLDNGQGLRRLLPRRAQARAGRVPAGGQDRRVGVYHPVRRVRGVIDPRREWRAN